MRIELFDGQEKFLADYQLLAKAGYQEEKVLNDVVAQLDEQIMKDDLHYQLAAEHSQDGQDHLFPFKKLESAGRMDAMISVRFIYDGEPHLYTTVFDERL